MSKKFVFKRVEKRDIEGVMEIINDAKALLKESSDQWQNGYPNESTMLLDIEKNQLYGLYDGDIPVAIAAMILMGEPDYINIEGEGWTLPVADSDLTVHRVAVKKEYYGQHLGRLLFDYAKKYGREKGCTTIKIDTHPNNARMQALLLGHGFLHRGTIHISHQKTDSTRMAFEYLLI